jgi:ribonuclease Z
METIGELIFLGTGAALPTPQRNLPTLAARIGTSWFLCDCSEGTQMNLMRQHVSAAKVGHIFISHLHGDHIFGLPGLLTSQQLAGREQDLHIWGPKGLAAFLAGIESVTGYAIRYPLQVHEFETPEWGPVDLGDFIVRAALLQHSRFCYGYRFDEKKRPGKFDEEKAKNLGIPFGPERNTLIHGHAITMADGRRIEPEAVVGQPPAIRSLAYCTDTRPCQNALDLARKATILLHDSTFTHALQQRAIETTHSTAVEAAQLACEAGVDTLFLYHISGRHNEAEGELLLQEAQAVFPSTLLPQDDSRWPLDRRH